MCDKNYLPLIDANQDIIVIKKLPPFNDANQDMCDKKLTPLNRCNQGYMRDNQLNNNF